MTTTIALTKLELAASAPLSAGAYRIEFSLTDRQGPMGLLTADKVGEPRSSVDGTITVEIPVPQATEAEVFAQAREILHAALTRLAERAKAPG